MIITRDKSFYKNLILLAIPISLQNLITFAVGFADNVMIGSLGVNAVSGVYMGNQMQTVLQMFVGGIESTILVLAAQYWGKKDKGNIRNIVSIGIKVSLLVGAVITILAVTFPEQIISLFLKNGDAGVIAEGATYLRIVGFSYLFFCLSQVLIATMRSVEVVRIGFFTSLTSLITNIMLNYILIFGKLGLPAMGVKGAAIATLISRIIEATIMVFYVFKVDKRLKFRFADILRLDMQLFKDFLRYGVPIIAGNLVWAINTIANTMILGTFGKEVLAAASITGMLHNLIYVWMTGLSSAVGIVTGKTVGAGLFEKMKEYAKTVQVMFLAVGIVSGIVTFLVREPFLNFYNVSPAAKDYTMQFMTVISITLIGTCYQAASLFGLVKSGGDISFVFKMDTISVFCVVIPVSILAMVLGAPAWVVFACLKCDQILKCFVAVVKINRFNWMKNLTR